MGSTLLRCDHATVRVISGPRAGRAFSPTTVTAWNRHGWPFCPACAHAFRLAAQAADVGCSTAGRSRSTRRVVARCAPSAGVKTVDHAHRPTMAELLADLKAMKAGVDDHRGQALGYAAVIAAVANEWDISVRFARRVSLRTGSPGKAKLTESESRRFMVIYKDAWAALQAAAISPPALGRADDRLARRAGASPYPRHQPRDRPAAQREIARRGGFTMTPGIHGHRRNRSRGKSSQAGVASLSESRSARDARCGHHTDRRRSNVSSTTGTWSRSGPKRSSASWPAARTSS